MAAHRIPVIVICAGALVATLGAGFLAAASPQEDRACAAGELQVERVFAVESTDGQGDRHASYFVELGNAQAHPQVFRLRFDAAGMEDAQDGTRATSLPGQQTVPLMLGAQALEPGAAPLSPDAIGRGIRLSCRSW